MWEGDNLARAPRDGNMKNAEPCNFNNDLPRHAIVIDRRICNARQRHTDTP